MDFFDQKNGYFSTKKISTEKKNSKKSRKTKIDIFFKNIFPCGHIMWSHGVQEMNLQKDYKNLEDFDFDRSGPETLIYTFMTVESSILLGFCFRQFDPKSVFLAVSVTGHTAYKK